MVLGGRYNYDHHLLFRTLQFRSGIWQAQALEIGLFDIKTCAPYHCIALSLRTRHTEWRPMSPKQPMVSAARPLAAMWYLSLFTTVPTPRPCQITSLGVNPCWWGMQEFWGFIHPIRNVNVQTILVKPYPWSCDSCGGDRSGQMKNRRQETFTHLWPFLPVRIVTSPGPNQLQKSTSTQSLKENHTTGLLICWMVIRIIELLLYIFLRILYIRCNYPI